ncbi:MAG: N-acetylglucosamine-6-phosphate deacetylase [Terriglobales bacterium]
MKIAITARTALTPLESIEHPVVIVEDGRILSVGSRDSAEIPAGSHFVELGDSILAPGFIEIHIHGGAAHDVMDRSREGLARFERHLTNYGVTSYCPTTVTAPLDATFKALSWLTEAKNFPRNPSRAKPLGLHLEGPFLSHAKRGVHPPEHLVQPSPEMFEKLWQAAHGNIAMVTIAPELPGALETIKVAASRNVCVSLGHSNATLEETKLGVNAGGRHATHTFNAMRALDHREPGILGEVLYNDAVSADIIADGVHVHPEMVSLFLRAKGRDRAVLITDALSATGMGDGHFTLGDFDVEVKGDRCTAHGVLAGSVLTLDRAVRNVRQFANWPLQHAIQLATLNPARALGHEDLGIIAPGAKADFVVLTPEGEVKRTLLSDFIE